MHGKSIDYREIKKTTHLKVFTSRHIYCICRDDECNFLKPLLQQKKVIT